MLTMGDPIRPKSTEDVRTFDEMFGERIRGNYEQMQGHINPLEILHFLSAPPEFYLAETNMTTLVSGQNGAEIQNLDVSLVNNVLNRILVTEQMLFTYQDRVFVENILKKLGVKDVQKFIRQVQMIKEETGTVRELLSLYESGRDVIRLIQEYRREHLEQRKTQELREKEEETEGEEAARLAAVVLNRLRIGDIYREVSSRAAFYIGDRTTVNRRELVLGEQNIEASYLALHAYRSRIFAQRQNVVYRRTDRYETWDDSRTDISYGQTVNHLVQTALLRAISQIFQIRYTDFSQHASWRHEFMDALHVSVQNTFQSLADFSERTSFMIRDKEAYHRTLQHFERQEIRELKSLFAKGTKVRDKASYEREQVQTTPQYRKAFFQTDRQDTEIAFMWPENGQPREHAPVEAAELRMEREKEIRECLERINRQNVERLERLSEYADRTWGPEKLRIDRESAKADALRVINGTGQTGTAHGEREMRRVTEKEQRTEKLREILGDETVRVFETIRGFQENPEQYPNVTASEEKTMNLFLRDIAAAGKSQTTVPAKEQEAVIHKEAERAAKKEAELAFGKTGPGVQPDAHRQGRTSWQSENTVELFHRQNSQTVDEESMREWMRTWDREKRIQNADIRKTFQEKEQVTEIVQAKVNDMKVKQDEEIARMISLNVKRQLDTLSEKVYGKLERRMESERRRRGL